MMVSLVLVFCSGFSSFFFTVCSIFVGRNLCFVGLGRMLVLAIILVFAILLYV